MDYNITQNDKTVYVIGHKNPDTDSICSAIAYADIKTRTGSGHYIPMRAGQLNSETRFVLDFFHFEAPKFINDVGTQVRDMDIRKSPKVTRDCSLKVCWQVMQDNSLVTLPIRTEDDHLDGLITKGDIAKAYMDSANDPYMLSKSGVRFGTIAETLSGTILTGDADARFTEGKTVIGTANETVMRSYLAKGDLILLASREENHLAALDACPSCIVFCLGAEITDKILARAAEAGCTVIRTDLDTYSAAKLLIQSIPVGYMMRSHNLLTFRTDDYTDVIKDAMVKNRHRAFPVLDKNGICVGTISRRNFLDIHRKQVVLVDHNELSQAVDNVEDAEILEIIDHHRLGDIQTMQPVLFRNEPVGCTATIMYRLYAEERLVIAPDIAGLLCAAIISDTLMFRSPTCTLLDKMAAGGLALIAGIHIEQFASEMFAAGSDLGDKSPEEIFYQDYKKCATDTLTFGISQISSMSETMLASLREPMLRFMENECGRNDVTQVYFMLTNIVTESTELLYYGSGCERMIQDAFKIDAANGTCVLPGVISRKKQLVPGLLAAAQEI